MSPKSYLYETGTKPAAYVATLVILLTIKNQRDTRYMVCRAGFVVHLLYTILSGLLRLARIGPVKVFLNIGVAVLIKVVA